MSDDLQRLARIVPSRPAGDLTDDQMLAKARGAAQWNLTVAQIEQIASKMLRLSLFAHGLHQMEWQPAQDLTVLITRSDGRDIRRRYTIAGQDHDLIYIDIYLHGEGIGTRWAKTLRAGDLLQAIGPRGKLLLDRDADWHVLIGDETSLPGIHAMVDATHRPTQVVVEVDELSDWQHLESHRPPGTQWTWLRRSDPQDPAAVFTPPPTGIGHAYVTGEARRVLLWRQELEQLGMDASAISHKAYWGTGRANATHGEPLA
jgi:NADPH-dependent ferric siderophore reductase